FVVSFVDNGLEDAEKGPASFGWSRLKSGFLVAGGTGIEPATCGFGDPIRRVGWCRAMSPETALPHPISRLMSLSVAVCRRSLGQILGQPMLAFSPKLYLLISNQPF